MIYTHLRKFGKAAILRGWWLVFQFDSDSGYSLVKGIGRPQLLKIIGQETACGIVAHLSYFNIYLCDEIGSTYQA